MGSNLFLDPLPDRVNVGGEEIPIETDFRAAIRFTLLMQDREVPDRMKPLIALKIFFGDRELPEPAAAFEAVIDFYLCGKKPKLRDGGSGGSSKAAYDFDFDSGMIFAAFLQQYRIDLTSADLHWWQFKTLFDALTADTEFMKIVSYRVTRIMSDMPKGERERIRRLQQIYALPDKRSPEEIDAAFAEALAAL